MNGLKNPGFSQSLLKYEETLKGHYYYKYLIFSIISEIYSGGLNNSVVLNQHGGWTIS